MAGEGGKKREKQEEPLPLFSHKKELKFPCVGIGFWLAYISYIATIYHKRKIFTSQKKNLSFFKQKYTITTILQKSKNTIIIIFCY